MIVTINMEETGANIEALRLKSGYSVKDLQEKLGMISVQAIYKWQRGRTLPSIDNLVILAEVFNVPLDSIIVREVPYGGD